MGTSRSIQRAAHDAPTSCTPSPITARSALHEPPQPDLHCTRSHSAVHAHGPCCSSDGGWEVEEGDRGAAPRTWRRLRGYLWRDLTGVAWIHRRRLRLLCSLV